jgi:cytosine deaminase
MLQLRDVTLPRRTGRWDVACEGERIATVQPHRPSPAPAADGLGGALVVPAFVDAHLHLDKAYLDAEAPNRSGTLAEAIELSHRLKQRLTVDDVHERIVRGATDALINGTTRLRTHVDVDAVVGLTGVRAALRARETLAGRPDMQVVAFPQEGLDDEVEDLLRESLALGCDAVGGIPARDDDPVRHIRRVFAIAAAFDVPVDMHVDESDDPRDLTLEALAEETLRRGWGGRVSAGHCCSLSAQSPATRARIIRKVADAGVHVVTLPSTNLYLQGREDVTNPRRGLTPVVELLAGGVNVVYASDNIQDPFNPFGNASMVETGLLLAHAAHMGGEEQLDEVFEMGTRRPAALIAGVPVMDTPADPIAPGAPADLLVIRAESGADVILRQRAPSIVVAGGQVAVQRQETVNLTAAD